MKNSALVKGCVIGFSIVAASVIGFYLWLSHYYKDGFSYGTWINGVYCTGKSINEINEELLSGREYGGLTVLKKDGESFRIKAQDILLTVSYTEPLRLYLDRQSPYLWIDNLIGSGGKKELKPQVEYDADILEQILMDAGIPNAPLKTDGKVLIRKTKEGYVLVNEREGLLNGKKACLLIEDALENGDTEVDLAENECYEDLPLTEEMEESITLFQKISDFQDCRIIYQMGDDQVPVDASRACDFIKLDESGNFVLDEQGKLCADEEKVFAFVDWLADTYDTVGTERTFHATRGDIVKVEGGIYGNLIDREAEKEYLLDAFLQKKAEIHTPVYSQMARKQGLDDIGDTYIEVDMTEQKLYYYEEGKLLIDTPVVTGNTSLRRGTPCGTNYVYAKQKNRTLRGADYESFVRYWIPVKGAIGIHDASWRSEYGGEIYKKSGSHGCINTPLDEVAKLYDLVEIGTPCVMFY